MSLIGIEACGSAHHWARELTKLGHEVALLNTRFVKSFVIGNKSDFNDTAAIFEAVTRPNQRIVAIKTMEQQDMQLIHNLQQGLVGHRTALVNQIRGMLSERNMIIPQGVNKVRERLPFILEDAENNLSSIAREVFAEQYENLCELEDAIKEQDRRINRFCNNNALSKRFLQVPGVGPMTATIIASNIGKGKEYQSSRDYAASLGVVPRQHSRGGKLVQLMTLIQQIC